MHNTLNSAFNQIMQTFCLREVNIPDFDAVLNGMNYPLCETFIYLRLIEIEKKFLSHYKRISTENEFFNATFLSTD